MSEPVLVVSGVPRSGTSLAMALLRAGGVELLVDGVRPPDADNPLGYHEYEPVKRLRRERAWVERAQGRAVKVISALLPALPEGPRYRVILMRRDLRAVVASQDRMLARRGAARRRIDADHLAAVFAAQLDETRAWLRSRSGLEWMELDYDALLRDPVPELSRLVEFAGLPTSPAALGALVSAPRSRGAAEGC